MITLLIALAATTARPITAPERAIIEQAVQPELSAPGRLGIEPVPNDAQIVCGRVNGTTFSVSITRNAKGRIVAAERPRVMTEDTWPVVKLQTMSNCMNAGYTKF